MSGTRGSAARLAARAGRPALRRGGTADLVEIALPPLGAATPVTGTASQPSRVVPPAAPADTASGSPAAVSRAAPAHGPSSPLAAGVLHAWPAPAIGLDATGPNDAEPGRRTPAQTPPLVSPVERVPLPGPSPAPRPSALERRRETVQPHRETAHVGLEAAAAPAPSSVSASAAAMVEAPPPHPTPESQPVVINRIEIVTPPARPPAQDPLASVAARRAGLSRHRGSR